NLPQLLLTVGLLIGGMEFKFEMFIASMITKGIMIIGNLIKGLWSKRSSLASKAGDLVKTIWNRIVSTDWVGLGGKIVHWIISGNGNIPSKIFGAFKSENSKYSGGKSKKKHNIPIPQLPQVNPFIVKQFNKLTLGESSVGGSFSEYGRHKPVEDKKQPTQLNVTLNSPKELSVSEANRVFNRTLNRMNLTYNF